MNDEQEKAMECWTVDAHLHSCSAHKKYTKENPFNFGQPMPEGYEKKSANTHSTLESWEERFDKDFMPKDVPLTRDELWSYMVPVMREYALKIKDFVRTEIGNAREEEMKSLLHSLLENAPDFKTDAVEAMDLQDINKYTLYANAFIECNSLWKSKITKMLEDL